METYILKKNVLTDDIIIIPNNNKIFKGNYIAIIKRYEFLNSWNDKEIIKRFRNKDILLNYLYKNYDKETINNIIIE